MGLHAVEDVIEEADGVKDMLALVQHYALGAGAHGGIGDLGARGDAGLGERFEHLGGPDYRSVRGFTEPQDFLLDLGETFEADFDGQIAPRHHDSDRMMAQGCYQAEGELIESLAAFDLEDDSQPAFAARCQFLLQFHKLLLGENALRIWKFPGA
jgi:hypothetical protein